MAADDNSFSVGVRSGMIRGDGKPFNDFMSPAGLYGRMKTDSAWTLALGVDLGSGDFEHPANAAGVTQSNSVKTIDATASSTTVRVWVEYAFTEAGSSNQFFGTVGLGYRRALCPNWSLDVYSSYDYHFADWTITDTVSSSTGSVNDYGTISGFVGLSLDF